MAFHMNRRCTTFFSTRDSLRLGAGNGLLKKDDAPVAPMKVGHPMCLVLWFAELLDLIFSTIARRRHRCGLSIYEHRQVCHAEVLPQAESGDGESGSQLRRSFYSFMFSG